MNKIDLKSVIDLAYSKSSLLKDLNYADAVLYALEALRLIKHPLLFEDKTSYIVISRYKGIVPCDFIQANQATGIITHKIIESLSSEPIPVSDIYNSDTDLYRLLSSKYSEIPTIYRIPMTYATNKFHSSRNEGSVYTRYTSYIPGYTISKGIITTDFEEGIVELSYRGIELDSESLPIIPDDTSLSLAIQYTIRKNHLERLWEAGTIPDKVYESVKQQYYLYIRQAESSLRMTKFVNADFREALSNTINQLIINKSSHFRAYSDLGDKEFIKRT